MNDNYLWDRTGEPDPEIQELEELLGTLRYQPRPLQIPADLTVARRRPFFLPMTIAAAIIMLAVLSALWFHFSRRPATPTNDAKQTTPVTPAPTSKPDPKPLFVNNEMAPQPRRQRPQSLVATYRPRPVRTKTPAPELTPQEQAEKEQVLVALRLVSAKLNLAQRKAAGPPSAARNQHRIG